MVWLAGEWTFHGRKGPMRPRLKTFIGLTLLVVFYLAVRIAAIGRAFQAGTDYFHGKSYLIRLLTMARFTAEYTLTSLATGIRSYVSYARPLVPDATAHDVIAWVLVGLVLGSVIVAARELR